MSDKPRTWTLHYDHKRGRGPWTEGAVFDTTRVIELEPMLDEMESECREAEVFGYIPYRLQAILREHGRLK